MSKKQQQKEKRTPYISTSIIISLKMKLIQKKHYHSLRKKEKKTCFLLFVQSSQ